MCSSLQEISDIKDIKYPINFGILPKSSGTFQLEFEVQKYDTTTKEAIGKPVTQKISFSVVEFWFKSDKWLSKKHPVYKYKKWKRNFRFIAFDGRRQWQGVQPDPEDFPKHVKIIINQHLDDGTVNELVYKDISWY